MVVEFISHHWVKIYAIASLFFFGFVWAMKKTYASKEQVEQLQERMVSLENKVKQLPDKAEVHKLQVNIAEVNGKLDSLATQLDSINRTTNMLLENELQGDKK